jgi:hypothetical protein
MRFKTPVSMTALALFAFFALAGCGGEEMKPADVVRAHFEALNREDLDAAMATIDDADSPNYEATKGAISQSFKLYDLNYTIESLTVDGATGKDEMQITVVQVTRKLAGPLFVNNRVTAKWKLTKRYWGWKFSATQVSTLEPLS